MTLRERILAVIQGREHDRVPFVQYDGLAGSNDEIWSVIGRDKMGIIRWSSVHAMDHPHCRFESAPFERDGRRGQTTTLYTPAGQLCEERLFEPIHGSSHIIRHYVKRPQDYCVLSAFLRDTVVREDIAHFLRDQQELGDDGVPMVSVNRTPYQQLWTEWVHIENLCLHLVDCPERVEECTELMAGIERTIFEIVRKAPVPFVDFPDNITAPVIGERYFRRYCVPLYNELADMLAARAVPVFVHMDGSLRPLWKAIGETRIGGIDSLSPPPDNDTSVGQAAAMWPQMRLFVNFPSSVHLMEPVQIRRQAEEMLAEAGHTGRLEIQISENMPPGAWRNSFPQIVRAIEEFGKPGSR
jgi:hypothetical protein